MSGTWDRLIETVEEGEALTLPWMAALNVAQSIYADSAYRGSLDNAKALHDDLMPGWTTVLGQNAHHGDWSAIVRLTEDGEIAHEYYGGADDLPARAWLLAILRAYAAQQEPTP